eukprot:scaffold257429_cov17-Prasinocladus_malaysianus.AAC.1
MAHMKIVSQMFAPFHFSAFASLVYLLSFFHSTLWSLVSSVISSLISSSQFNAFLRAIAKCVFHKQQIALLGAYACLDIRASQEFRPAKQFASQILHISSHGCLQM